MRIFFLKNNKRYSGILTMFSTFCLSLEYALHSRRHKRRASRARRNGALAALGAARVIAIDAYRLSAHNAQPVACRSSLVARRLSLVNRRVCPWPKNNVVFQFHARSPCVQRWRYNGYAKVRQLRNRAQRNHRIPSHCLSSSPT